MKKKKRKDAKVREGGAAGVKRMTGEKGMIVTAGHLRDVLGDNGVNNHLRGPISERPEMGGRSRVKASFRHTNTRPSKGSRGKTAGSLTVVKPTRGVEWKRTALENEQRSRGNYVCEVTREKEEKGGTEEGA